MARLSKIMFGLFLVGLLAAGCQRNYYTSKAKGSDCGCPNKKGMVGY